MRKQKIQILSAILCFMLFPLVSSQVQIGEGTQDGVIITPPSPPIVAGNGSFNQTLADDRYLRLDGGNSPTNVISWDGQSLEDVFSLLVLDRINLFGDFFIFSSTIEATSSSMNIRDIAVTEDVNIDRNLSVDGNITFGGFIYGNGSQLTDVCLSDGTNCQTLAEANFTNVAYLNNTQTFTGHNTFESGIDISDATGTINFTTAGENCINWEQGIGDTSICSQTNIIDISATNTRFPKSLKLTVGSGTSGPGNTYGLDVQSSGNNDFFYFIPNNKEWGLTYPIGWDLSSTNSQGLLFDVANLRQKYNITWTNYGCILSNDCGFQINTRGDLRLTTDSSYAGNVTTNSDFCIIGGNCLSQMTGDVADGIANNTWSYARLNKTDVAGGWYDDEYLQFSAENGNNYSFEFNMLYDGTNDGIKYNVTYTGTGELNYGWSYQYGSTEGAGLCINNCGEFGNVVTTSDGMMIISGTLNPTSAGTLKIMYAEEGAGLGVTVIEKGSNLEVNLLE